MVDYETVWVLAFAAVIISSGFFGLLSIAQNNPQALPWGAALLSNGIGFGRLSLGCGVAAIVSASAVIWATTLKSGVTNAPDSPSRRAQQR